ncbi:MAG: hypothetical protein EPGJADBJ_00664 [Saprospiraceae bacterium]|nr:hypothetical protein [Saprospiraceae bacterium]
MAVSNFEISGLGAGTVVGTCELHEGLSGAGFPESPVGGSPSNNLFQSDQDLIVRVKWDEFNPDAIFLIGGEWRIDVLIEPIDTGGAASVKNATQVSNGQAGNPYQVDLTFLAGTLPLGLHRVVVAMQWFSTPGPGGLPGPLASFSEIGVIKIYQEP